MAQIVPLMVAALADHLKATMQTQIPTDDLTRVNSIVVGRFQDDPTDPIVHLAISGGDPDNPSLKDGILSLDDHEDIFFNAPPREIGGGDSTTRWWRKGVVEIGCYYIIKGITAEVAMDYAYTVLGRVTNEIENAQIAGLTDDFGEQAYATFVYASEFAPSGGEDARIYRGKVHWAALTSR